MGGVCETEGEVTGDPAGSAQAVRGAPRGPGNGGYGVGVRASEGKGLTHGRRGSGRLGEGGVGREEPAWKRAGRAGVGVAEERRGCRRRPRSASPPAERGDGDSGEGGEARPGAASEGPGGRRDVQFNLAVEAGRGDPWSARRRPCDKASPAHAEEEEEEAGGENGAGLAAASPGRRSRAVLPGTSRGQERGRSGRGWGFVGRSGRGPAAGLGLRAGLPPPRVQHAGFSFCRGDKGTRVAGGQRAQRSSPSSPPSELSSPPPGRLPPARPSPGARKAGLPTLRCRKRAATSEARRTSPGKPRAVLRPTGALRSPPPARLLPFSEARRDPRAAHAGSRNAGEREEPSCVARS